MKTIYLVGSRGKIGTIIKRNLLDNSLNKNDLKLYLLDRPPYKTDEIKSINSKKNIIILCFYTKNIFSYINTISKIIKIFSFKKDNLFIEICSVIQLTKIYDILKHPKYLAYYFNRRFQSILFIILLKIFTRASIIKIYFGKIQSKVNDKKTLSTVTQKYFINLIKNIILNIKSDSNAEFIKEKILYNPNPIEKGSKIDNLLDKNIKRSIIAENKSDSDKKINRNLF
tara:strand:+ start:467 stop:1147 length:681 start_codon:yes stop_codon:yes gene_type:complete